MNARTVARSRSLGFQVDPARCPVCRGEREELRQVAVVGGDGMRRRVAIEPEVVEERRGAAAFMRPLSRDVGATRVDPFVERRSARSEVAGLALGPCAACGARWRLRRRHDAEGDVGRLVVVAGWRATRSRRAHRSRSCAAASRGCLAARRAPRRCGRRSGRRPPTRRSLRRPEIWPAKNRSGRAFVCQVSRSTVGPLM